MRILPCHLSPNSPNTNIRILPERMTLTVLIILISIEVSHFVFTDMPATFDLQDVCDQRPIMW